MDKNNQSLEKNETGKCRVPVITESCVVFLLYLVLVVIITWPLLRNIRFEVLGHPALSLKVHLWQYWWTGHSLLSSDHDLAWCPLLFHPDGVNTVLKFGNFLFPFAGVPFQYAFGLIAGYNVTLMLFIAATGLATYLLCRRFVLSRLACFVAGTVYAFLPYSLMENFNGATEIAVLLWIPICFIQVDRWLKSQSLYQGLILGLVLFLSAMSSWYYGVYLGMAVALAAGIHMLAEWRKKQLSRELFFRLSAGFGVAVIVFALLMSPFTAALHTSARIKIDWRHLCEDQWMKAKSNPDVCDTLGPWQKPLDSKTEISADNRIAFPFCMFPGFLALALGVLGLSRRSVLPGYFVIVLLFFWLLSLGPWLKISGQTEFLGIKIPLVSFAIISVWQDFSASLMHSYRAICVGWLALAVLASVGAEQLFSLPGMTSLRRAGLLAVFLLLVMVDSVDSAHLEYPISRTNAEPLPVYDALRDTPGNGAVINIPLREHSLLGSYLLPQVQHQRPLMLPDYRLPYYVPYFVNYLELLPNKETGQLVPVMDPGADLLMLRNKGFRFFVIHWSLLSPEVGGHVRGVMERYCKLVIDDPQNRLSVYEITAGSETRTRL